ncbi:15901_t:CDS:2, partial [Rhizophagus irregularis]
MTATLRTTKYMHYTLPDSIGEETIVNEYFKKVEAQYWQLKHYLNYRLKNERVIIPWVQIYEDWLQSLKNIRGTNHKGMPGCVSSLCIELLNVTNSFEGVSVLESCMQWYNKFYERNFELQFAERTGGMSQPEDHSARGWDDAINNTIISNTDSDILMNTKKLMKETLPKFLKAFSLTTLNPLRDITILEKPHLNQFVHPIMDSALWIFAKVYYIYGEIPLKGMKTKVRADGVGFLNDVINYPIVCGEGARPGASQQKSVDDDVKNAKSMVELYNNIVISEADAHRQLFTDLKTYGITAFKTEVSLTMMDFRSTHRLFEVDNFGLPRDWADMPNFVWLYEAVIKWALCANATRGALIDHRKKRRL